MQVEKHDYEYIKLNDVKPANSINVYGVVKYFTKPIITKTREYSLLVSLVDTTLYEETSKLKCIFFGKNIIDLPEIADIGDVVRIHRLKVVIYNNELQGQNKKGVTNFLVFSGKIGNSLTPRSTSSNYTLTTEDFVKVKTLRQWAAANSSIFVKPQCFHFEDVCMSKYYDIACQIVSTCCLGSGECLLLQVWDGTKVPGEFKKIQLTDEDGKLNVCEELAKNAGEYLVNVFLYDDHCWKGQSLKPGQYILLNNLHAAKSIDEETDLPCFEFILHKGSAFNRGATILREESEIVNNLKRLFDQIIANRNATHISLESKHPQQMENDMEDLPKLSEQESNSISNSVEDRPLLLSLISSEIYLQKNDEIEIDFPFLVNKLSDSTETKNIITAVSDLNIDTITKLHQIKPSVKYRCTFQVLDYIPKAETPTSFLKLFCPTCKYLSSILSLQESFSNTATLLENMADQVDKATDCLRVHQMISPNVNMDCDDYEKIERTYCPRCSPEGASLLVYIYMMKFIVTDGSCVAEVLLWKDQAITFFQNITPEKLLIDSEEFKYIQSMLSQIKPQGKSLSDYPWLDCCLQSYTTKTGLKLQIIDTTLL